MSKPFAGERVFVHEFLQGQSFYLKHVLGLTPVADGLSKGDNSIEARFLRSLAPIALIDAHPFVYDHAEELLDSDILRKRAICVIFPYSRNVRRFNKELDDLGFLTISIDAINNVPLLSGVLLNALANAKATS